MDSRRKYRARHGRRVDVQINGAVVAWKCGDCRNVSVGRELEGSGIVLAMAAADERVEVLAVGV